MTSYELEQRLTGKMLNVVFTAHTKGDMAVFGDGPYFMRGIIRRFHIMLDDGTGIASIPDPRWRFTAPTKDAYSPAPFSVGGSPDNWEALLRNGSHDTGEGMELWLGADDRGWLDKGVGVPGLRMSRYDRSGLWMVRGEPEPDLEEYWPEDEDGKEGEE